MRQVGRTSRSGAVAVTTAMILGGAALAGCASASGASNSAGGGAGATLNIGAGVGTTIQADFNPFQVATLAATSGTDMLYLPLETYNQLTGAYTPFLATGHDIVSATQVDFTLRSGELVFITGGNGSGKSTFLRVLAGLYPPNSGEITLDGMSVDDHNRNTYRALMSAIFFDYHLFQRLYGIPEGGAAELERLLAQFRLSDKTGLVNGEFRTLDLSGGQRRRLALIVSLLEKRPILLLDEWTAEQDPEFRRKFYDELLPDLMAAGATIVVITHDDRYLDELTLRARRVRMDEGRIVEQRTMNMG